MARSKSSNANTTCLEMESLNLVSKEGNEGLLKPIHDSEIKDVIFQMDTFTALGSYGFSVPF